MLRALLLGAMLVLAPSLAMAIECRIPPRQFDHAPTQPYRVVEDAGLVGNSFTTPDRSTVILPAHASAQWKRCYLRHEIGHVNGWTADHPGERRVRM